MDWDYYIDKFTTWFLQHARFAQWGHALWFAFVAFPKETGEFVLKVREAVSFWKKLGKEAHVGKWLDLIKLVPEIEGIVTDVETVEAEASQSPAVQKLITDLKALIANAKAVTQ